MSGFVNEKYEKLVHYAYGASGTGESPEDPKAFAADGDILAIPAGLMVEDVSVIVRTAITGATQLDVGDDDDADGFVSAATLTANAVTRSDGAYLVGNTLAKYYAAAGKEVKLDVTGTPTAGVFAVKISGHKIV